MIGCTCSFLTAQPLLLLHAGSEASFTRELEGGLACFLVQEAEGPDGREVCRASSLPQTLLVSAMCKQLYWSWVSTFTSGIRLEERPAADGKALQQQVMSPQVRGLALCASCVILGSGG